MPGRRSAAALALAASFVLSGPVATGFVRAPAAAAPGRPSRLAPQRGVFWPEVSPDGRHILYESPTRGGPIHIAEADGAHARVLAPGTRVAWFPDGQRILAVVKRGSKDGLVVLGPEGGASDTLAYTHASPLWRPRISPDGTRIVLGENGPGPHPNVFHVLRRDGTEVRDLHPSARGEVIEPTWSHDGRLAFVAVRRDSASDSSSTDLYTMNGDGTGERKIATMPGGAQWITWSPDDRRIALQDDRGQHGDIVVVDVATGDMRRIAPHTRPYLDETPSWSSDGHIYFQSDRTGTYAIYRMNPDGSGQRCLLGCATGTTGRTVALTFDDLPWVHDSVPLDSVEAGTRRILGALRRHHAPAVAFVVGSKVLEARDVDGRLSLLRAWRDAGVRLANHGYDHLHFQTTPLARYEDNMVQGDVVPALLMNETGAKPLYYRPPYNQTGPTREIRDDFRAFLAARDYTLAPFTVEDVDYAFDDLLRNAAGDSARRARIEATYRAFFDTTMAYGEKVARETFGREIPQVLLLHANRLNARNLGWILSRLEARGYHFVALREALRDPAYATPDGYVGRWGISWLDRWRMGMGLHSLLRSSPDPPRWVLDDYRRIH